VLSGDTAREENGRVDLCWYSLRSYCKHCKHCIRTIALIFVRLSTPSAYYYGYIAVMRDMGRLDTLERMSEEGARVSNVL